MRPVISITAVLLLAAMPLPASALDGILDLSWDACSPIVSHAPSVTPGGTISLYASVTGHDVPHKAYNVTLLYGNPTTASSPDAWRFDASGCNQGLMWRIDHLAPAEVAAACPTFQGNLPSFQIKDLNLVPAILGLPTTLMRLVLWNAYPAGNTVDVDPNRRYFLGRFFFDHSASVNGPTIPDEACGGLETPMCFTVYEGEYVTLDGYIGQFRTGGTRSLSISGSGPLGDCLGPVPAQSTTWGQIKSQYRN